ncbi:testis-expressed protein 9 [Culicoides brevitarsis]|uniref:testis-expressed protein 9 n=1 Tax=Culicoides brevitarsis TaxID=469753 RepID=UPI00307B597B
MFPENYVAEILDREKELIRLNERINQGSPKLFNKNEKAAIITKKFDKNVWKPEKVEIKTEAATKQSPPICTRASRCESSASTHSSNKDLPVPKSTDTTSDNLNVVPRVLERKHVNKDNLIKFLKAKVAILQNELESAVSENKEQNETIKELTKKIERSDVAYNALDSNHASLQQTVKKLEEKNAQLRDVIQEKDDRIQAISKEQARVSAEWSKLKKLNQTLEVRLTQLRQTHEATKARLNELSDAEKEIRFSKTQERATLEGQIKELKRERMQMLNAFKKQLLRIDQLKQQNNCFDEEKLIEIAEREYMKLLKWSSGDQPNSH